MVKTITPKAAAGKQQLQIVDNDQANALLPLQPPRPRSQRRNGERGCIVNIERQLL